MKLILSQQTLPVIVQVGCTPNKGAKELGSPRMFNHNLSAKVFDDVCHSEEDRLHSRSAKQQSEP